MQYQAAGVPLLVIAGKEYGSGSSRDWAAKGTQLLGVKAVIAESFERIHRSNLVNMGVLPLQFKAGQSAAAHGLTGLETYELTGVAGGLKPMADISVSATAADGSVKRFTVIARIDTPEEVVSYQHGGILPYVLRQLVGRADRAGPRDGRDQGAKGLTSSDGPGPTVAPPDPSDPLARAARSGIETVPRSERSIGPGPVSVGPSTPGGTD